MKTTTAISSTTGIRKVGGFSVHRLLQTTTVVWAIITVSMWCAVKALVVRPAVPPYPGSILWKDDRHVQRYCAPSLLSRTGSLTTATCTVSSSSTTRLWNILHPGMTDEAANAVAMSASAAAADGIFYHHHNAHHVTLAGSLWPTLQKLKIGPAKLKAMWTNVYHITDWKDLAVLSLLAFGLTPVAKFIYQRMNQRYRQQQKLKAKERMSIDMNDELGGTGDSDFFTSTAKDDDDDDDDYLALNGGRLRTRKLRSMYQMKRFGAVAFIDQIAKVALSVYAVDVASILLSTIGFTFPKMWRLSEVYAKIAYSTWAVQRFLRYKTIALCRLFRVDEESMGRVELLDRLLNGVIVGIGALVVLDWMSVKMNNAMTGLFAFGSAGTLAFTLASQGLVTQLISGIFLMFSDKMYVGDSVAFGDGTSGKVLKLGWMETTLRDSNNIVTRVPNTLLSVQKVSNLSRVKQCQVKQALRFHYKDASVLPQLLDDIKMEIRKACPRLILDNTRPFRAVWTDYSEDHLEVMIDTHFNIAPYSDAYWTNRQNVLMAITKAITNYNASLVPKQSDMVLRTYKNTKGTGVPPVVMTMTDAGEEPENSDNDLTELV